MLFVLKRRAFTIMELMVVIGILGIIAAVVVAAINPTEQLIDAQDAKRRNQVNALQKALFQYSIDAGGELPNQGSISTDSASPTNICREGQTGSCVVFDSLVPNYLTELPVDPTETGSDLTGFAIYTDTYGRANVVANYLGQSGGSSTTGGGGDTTDPTISSTTPTDDASGSQTGADLTIVFSEAVTKQTGNITLKRTIDDTTIETIDVTTSAVSVSDETVTINPSSSFDYSTGVYVQIDGTAFDDSAGNSFAGIATTTEWNFVTGRAPLSNRAYAFDGTDDYVEIADHNDFSFGNGSTDSAFSIAGWIYISTTDRQTVLGKADDTGAGNLEYFLGPNGSSLPGIYLYDNTSSHQIRSLADSAITTGWHHMVGTYDGSGDESGLTVYIDGSAVAQTRNENGTYVAMHNTTSPVFLGSRFKDHVSNYAYNDGRLFDVRIYSKELTSDEVTHIYNFGSSGTDPGTANLVGLWKSDDVNPDISFDSSGNDHHGIKTNITTGTFHYTGSDVPYSWLNTVGYSDGYYYDGVDDYHNTNTNAAASSGSIEVWSMLSDFGASSNMFAGLHNSTDDRMALNITTSDKDLRGYIGDDSGSSTRWITTMETLTPYNLKMAWNAGSSELFSGGSSVDTGTYTGNINTTRDIYLAARNNNGSPHFYLNGIVSRFVVRDDSNTITFDTRTDGFGTAGSAPVADYIPRNESNTSVDVLGSSLEYSGPSS